MKVTISATVDKELSAWIEKKLRSSRQYRNKSHLIEQALTDLRESEEKKR